MELFILFRKYRNPILASITIIILLILSIIVLFYLARLGISSDDESNNTATTLKFVQVIFRHGERTNVNALVYPTDPNINFTYSPYGYGQLTNNGKKQMYELGKYLRQRYHKFLGDLYHTDLLRAISSSTLRTQLSLQLVLAGLFPPKHDQIWESDLNWQPIPYTTLSPETNKIFESLCCPSYRRVYREFVNSSEMRAYYQENKEFFDYFSLHSGWNLTTPTPITTIYYDLVMEKLFGLTFPGWLEKFYPNPLQKYAIDGYKCLTGTDLLKRLFIGFLLKQCSNEIYDKIDGKLNAKISLYSGHEFNIVGIGTTLNLFDYQIIPFAAYLLIELHQINDNYILKFYYQDYKQPEPKELDISPYGRFITVNAYSKLVEKYLPEDDECEDGPGGLQEDLSFLVL